MSQNTEKTSYFFDKIFPEFVRFFFAGLLLIFSLYLGKNATSNNKTVSPFSFEINKDLALLIYIIVLLYAIKLIFTSFKNLLVRYNDSKQIEYHEKYMANSELYHVEKVVTVMSKDNKFYYRVGRVENPVYLDEDFLPDRPLSSISNPKCTKDDCMTELISFRTYFGKYSYECPSCHNKVKSRYSTDTLKEHMRLIEKKEILLFNIQKEKEEELQQQKEEEQRQREEELKRLQSLEDPFKDVELPF